MSQHADILTNPPFYPIEGVDATAPLQQQMEQIDQLNTLLLQQIDANFARLHATVTTRILPEIKRFALANQPTREAAQFWQEFFTLAFGERPGEGSTVDETHYDDTHSELGGSFFDPAATSTPMKDRDVSLDDSLGSPFDRVDRQLSRLSITNTDEPTPSLPRGYDFDRSLSPDTPNDYDSTLRFHAGSTPRPALPDPDSPTAHRSPSTMLLDITSTTLGEQFGVLSPSSRSMFRRAHRTSAQPSSSAQRHILDEDDDVKLGMSPPKTMNYVLPPTAQRIMTVAATPIKASDFDLMDMDYEPSPRQHTPAELRRYSLAPHDLAADLAAARKEFDAPIPGPSIQKEELPTARRLFERQDTQRFEFDESTYGYRPRRSLANTSYGSDIEIQRDVTGRIIGDDESIDDADDSFDDTAGYAEPAAQDFELVDNSFDSDASGYPRGSDSFTGETSLFGNPAAGGGAHFALHQQDEMVTYHGGRLEDAAGPDSPTRRR
ncbi:hypothetical protein CcaverHIS002_0405730 [Cutaneotrichosporon cavernicola]|uniref:DASH complex subunit ASK1 n=1 Tax=Cutaneotrichosporon cavernicola TaxID=279322 RepID=A0AA48L4F4_9TREE|nr:uncharacterized protein CcaverHIS019_0405730 [Cutaneotrichosporon cavernicola]BEI83969.1 hypothetical protein CcaverHIS002_0405730 [Cutaneotrichosporon cavernicola]BEI91753.1 hypothetical protein CcaverHIS019_0405730 [Cutaneotrichosporon cavernicola]BEI99524.1 hypothetical protein CcaverHIS631_0405670 [Cutaneotrichosporon cavernicola]BEJ07302.1 hypothetical protein CcaverHIS641_0405710 [Cutaneotrichosporon cavernicola]